MLINIILLKKESLNEMSNVKLLVFQCTVEGFHIHPKCWNPEENELFNFFHGPNNLFDMFALDRDALFEVNVLSTHYHQSPLAGTQHGVRWVRFSPYLIFAYT